MGKREAIKDVEAPGHQQQQEVTVTHYPREDAVLQEPTESQRHERETTGQEL